MARVSCLLVVERTQSHTRRTRREQNQGFVDSTGVNHGGGDGNGKKKNIGFKEGKGSNLYRGAKFFSAFAKKGPFSLHVCDAIYRLPRACVLNISFKLWQT